VSRNIDLDAARAALTGNGQALPKAREVCPLSGGACHRRPCGPDACTLKGLADPSRFPIHDDDEHPVMRRHLRVALAEVDRLSTLLSSQMPIQDRLREVSEAYGANWSYAPGTLTLEELVDRYAEDVEPKP